MRRMKVLLNLINYINKMTKDLEQILNKHVVTEKEILLLKRRLNNNKVDIEDIREFMGDDEYQITTEQEKKGVDFLNKYCYTSKHIPRKHVFEFLDQGELDIIDTFQEFKLIGFKDMGNGYVHNFVPIYRCIGADNGWFDYYYINGNIIIN